MGQSFTTFCYLSIWVINSYKVQMAKKLTQQEIDQLLQDSDSDKEHIQEEDQAVNNQVDQEYPEEFSKEDNERVEEEYRIEDEPEIQSQIESEKFDEVSENYQKGSGFQFKKEEDLSEAQSQFIQSSRLNDGVGLRIKSNFKSPDNSQEAITKLPKKQTNVKKKDSTKVQANQNQKSKNEQKPPSKKVIQKKKEQKVTNRSIASEKEKLSESQIKRKMKEIEQQKKKRQQRKQDQKKKQQQIRRKEYEQAKLKQQQRKQKNRKILQQQKAKKNNLPSKVKIEPQQQQVKIPQKPTDFKYLQMKKQKVKNEKLIQKKIEEQNLLKLKRLNNNKTSELKGQAKKIAILQERKQQLERQKKQKAKEEKEQDVLIIKQIKKQIMECKKFNLQKNNEINRAERSIEDLKKKIKEKEKVIYLTDMQQDNKTQDKDIGDISELSPIEQLVFAFPEANTVDQIFTIIDQNGDSLLSSKEICSKLTEFNLDKAIITKIQEVLDENCDGTVDRDQFVFLVQLQMKRQKDLRSILGDLNIMNPTDIQVKILDMQGKIKYINRQIEKHKNSNENEGYSQKIDKLERKAEKIQSKIKKEMVDYTKQGNNKEIGVNSVANLTNQYIKLKNEKTVKLNFLEKLRKKVKDNLQTKNRLLASRVEESLRLEEEVYKIKNDIQQRELRFLSLKKMEQNKKGYLQRQSQKRRQLQEAYKRTKEYQVLIADPAKKAQKTAQAFQMKFLAAVLMIQRNYRKKKALRQFQRLRAQRDTK